MPDVGSFLQAVRKELVDTLVWRNLKVSVEDTRELWHMLYATRAQERREINGPW